MVFDYNPSKNTWSPQSLKDAFLKGINGSGIEAGIKLHPHKVISEPNSKSVQHPVFGDTERFGWARMRKGQDVAIMIEKKLSKRERKKRKIMTLYLNKKKIRL